MRTNTVGRAVALVTAMALLPWHPAAAAQSATNEATSHAEKVVVQVSDDDPKPWGLALNNIRNLQAALGADKVDITLVTYGPGIDMLMFDSIVANRIASALEAGVHMVACENTLTSRKIDRADMHPGVGFVPSGVVEIVERQRQGWSYLRP